jgi:IS30 family transposase
LSTKIKEAFMKYHQLTLGERYEISALRRQGCSVAEIARALRRHRSTIMREIRRNSREDGAYRPAVAHDFTRWRRSWSRRNTRFAKNQWARIEPLLKRLWSPRQISGRLRRMRRLSISHQTIYEHIWRDRTENGDLYTYLRQSDKQLRKRYGRRDSRGRLAGKAHISQRPPGAENRSRFGHFEADTMIGSSDQHCVVTLVDRKNGYALIGKLRRRSVDALNRRLISLIRHAPVPIRTITVDNGTEFHGYKEVERATGVRFYFANPHHSWERGTNENTNGLIRQYLPKGKSMRHLTQRDCRHIYNALNSRPRERLNYLTPAEVYAKYLG